MIAVVAWTEGARATAARAADLVGGEVVVPEGVADTLRALFAAGRPIVGVCAAGILIRALAPMLGDKRTEPPVLALAEDGSVAVPLLGGHRGANDLARRLAGLGAQPAVTTAGDLRLGAALDQVPEGWSLEGDPKPAMAALLDGASARLVGEAPWLAGLPAERAPGAPDRVVLTVAGAAPLIWRRRALAVGVGCARHCDPAELIGLVRKTLAEAGHAAGEVAGVWSVDLKADEAAVHALAADLGVPARFFPAARLEAERDRLATPSEVVFAEVGAHGVAEGAALAAAGPGGALEAPKVKSAMATCALARLGPAPEAGRPRGRLAVVGIGPGAAEWRTPEASRLVAEAEELVGYDLYLDLLGPLAAGKPRAAFPLGAETERCRHALARAAEGRSVALVSSGDAGIYAMAALVAELAPDVAPLPEIVIAPGISALQAAAARAGALLGHDFCAISLSDLLTPREAILARLRAAAAGDFVVALYNPASARRRSLLPEAREILLTARPPETPVLLARNLGRPGEALLPRTLAGLDIAEVDMLTVVLVGSSASRAVRLRDGAAFAGGTLMYTPRGYAAKETP